MVSLIVALPQNRKKQMRKQGRNTGIFIKTDCLAKPQRFIKLIQDEIVNFILLSNLCTLILVNRFMLATKILLERSSF